MRGGGQLESAADHRPVQRDNDRSAAELNGVEGAVPHARMEHALERLVLLGDLAEVEAGGKMRALPGQHHGANVARQSGEESLEPKHCDVIERIALLRAREAQVCYDAAPSRLQRLRQLDRDRFFCCLVHPSLPSRQPVSARCVGATRPM